MSEPIRFFQFLAGERNGEVLVLKDIIDDDGMVLLEFRDNSRCNEELVLPLNDRNYTDQLMAEVSDPTNVWKFDTKYIGREEERWSLPENSADGKAYLVQPFKEGRKSITPSPPRKVNSNFGNITARNTTPESTREAISETPGKLVPSGDPVYGIMEAAKKFPTPVEVEISIMLPKKSLFEVADESFEDGGKKVVEYIIENLDISDLKEALRRSLHDAYGQPLQEELTTEELLLEEPIIEKDETRIEEISDKLVGEIEIVPEPLPEAFIIEGEPEAVEEPIIGEPAAAPSES